MEDGKAELLGLSAALDNTGVCTFMYFPRDKTITVPEKARAMYQCAEYYENMPYSFAEDFVYKDDQPGFNDMYFKIDAGVQTATFVFRNHELTARCHVTLTTVSADESGAPHEVLGIIENESNEMIRTMELNRLVEALSYDCFAVLSADLENDGVELMRTLSGSVEALSEFFETQPTYQEYIDYCAMNLVAEPDRRDFASKFEARRIAKMLRESKSITLRYKRTYESETHDLEARFVDISEKGDGSHAVLAYRYIDDLVKAEEKQRQQDAIFRSLGNVFFTIHYFDMRSRSYWEITSAETVRIFIESEGTIKKALDALCDTLVVREFRNHMRDFTDMATLNARMRDRDVISTDYRGLTAGWMQAMFIVDERDAAGNVQQLLFVTRQINEEKQKEEDYRQGLEKAADESRRANLAKTEFLSRMSHDIRTPLNGIIGMLDIEDRYPGDAAKQAECHIKIRTASAHLLSLVNDVLDMSRLETGAVEYTEEPFDLTKLLDDCYEMVAIQANNADVSVEFQKEYSAAHRYLIGSPLHVRQIVLNIATNAVKYNKRFGTLNLRVAEIGYAEDIATLAFTFTDSGIGMDEEFLRHVFEPFSQENQSARTEYQGTGLGLSLAKAMAEQMGGTIAVQSRKGVGSTFVVTLPLKIDHDGESRDHQADDVVTAQNLKGMRLLLVEDNELNAEIARFMLEDAGAEVTGVTNGQLAVDAFAGNPPQTYDAILMDVMMPVLDGLDATRVIRALDRPDARTIPIIAMTANAFEEDVKRCEEAGMNAHIAKPLDMQKALSTIAKTKAGVVRE